MVGWHNGAETGIQFPELYSDVQDSVPITSITKNARMRWINDELNEYSLNLTVSALVESVSAGTRLVCPNDGSYLSITSPVGAENGKTYNYLINLPSITSGNVYLSIGGATLIPLAVGINAGQLTATADSAIFIARNTKPVDLIVSQFYVWEEGTIPPLFYDEFESDFNEKHQVFSDVTPKKKKSIALYDVAQSESAVAKIAKCVKANIWKDGFVWDDTDTWYD